MSDNHIGKTLYAAAALPATNDATGFEALTWVKVNGLIAAPTLGVTHDGIDVPDLQTGFTSAVKGAASGNDATMEFRSVASDTGQGNLRTAANSQAGTLSIKIVDGSGTNNAPVSGDQVEYAQGYAHSFTPNDINNSSFRGFTVGFRQNNYTVVATEPA